MELSLKTCKVFSALTVAAISICVCSSAQAASTVHGTASITAGALSLTVPSGINFSGQLLGQDMALDNTNASGSTFQVQDATGSNNGWNVTAYTEGAFDNGSSTLPLNSLSLNGSSAGSANTSSPTSLCASNSTCTIALNTESYPVSIPAVGTSGSAIYNASTQSGEGTENISNVNWWLQIPANTRGGTYTTTVVISLNSGPYPASASATGAGTQSAYSQAVENSNPTTYIPMSGTLADAISGGPSLTSYSTSTSTSGGPFSGSGATTFTGASGVYDSFNSAPLAGDTAWSMELWYDDTSTTNWQYLFDSGNGGASSPNQSIDLSADCAAANCSTGNDSLLMSLYNSSASPATGGEANVANPGFNKWIMLDETESSSGVLSIYVNGSLVATGQTTAFPRAINMVNSFLGRSEYPSDPYFTGKMSNLSFYSTTLTPAQITAHYQAG